MLVGQLRNLVDRTLDVRVLFYRGRNLRTIRKSQKLQAGGLVSYVELVKLCRSKDIALIVVATARH
jgi:hypothetical protein